MALKPERIEIDKCVFFVHKPQPFVALQRFGDMQKLLAKPLASLDVDGVMDEIGAGTQGGLTSIMRVVAQLSSVLDGKTLQWLCDLLLDPQYVMVAIDGNELYPERLSKDLANKTFAEDFSLMIELAVRVAMVQYGAVFRRGLRHVGVARHNQTETGQLEASATE